MTHDFFIKAVGVFAGLGTTISFSPQVIHLLQSDDIPENGRIYMFLIHSIGVSLWIFYGILIHDFVIIGFNGVTAALVLVCIMRTLYLHQSNKTCIESSKCHGDPAIYLQN